MKKFRNRILIMLILLLGFVGFKKAMAKIDGKLSDKEINVAEHGASGNGNMVKL